MTEKPSILVIGAGPTGLTAALELARLGIQPDVVERRSEPSELSRAVGILPETIDKLMPSGAGAAIRAEAMKIQKINIYRGDRPLMRLDFTNAKYREHVMLGLPQNRTEELLREALQRFGGDVQYGREATEISTTDKVVSVQFADAKTRTYDWVIAADGLHSRMREALGIAYPGFDLDDEWSVADIDLEGYDNESVTGWIQEPPGEFVFVIPIGRTRVRLAASTSDAIAALPVPLNITNIRRTGAFQIAIRQAETYKKGRVLLAGDAAHCHSPVGGRGMNLGIDDAIVAATSILNGTTDTYTEARHKIGRRVLRGSERGRKLVCANGGFTKAITAMGMAAVHRTPFLRRMFLRVLTSL